MTNTIKPHVFTAKSTRNNQTKYYIISPNKEMTVYGYWCTPHIFQCIVFNHQFDFNDTDTYEHILCIAHSKDTIEHFLTNPKLVIYECPFSTFKMAYNQYQHCKNYLDELVTNS